MDIATLGIRIDTTDVSRAETELDGLTEAGVKSEAAAKGVENAWAGVGQKVGDSAAPVTSAAGAFKQSSEEIKKQQDALGQLLGRIDPVVRKLGELDEMERQLRDFKIGGQLDTETFNDFQGRINASRNALAGVDDAIRKTGRSSAQTSQALQQLPMQFSDIFVSLQAGQSPLQVFLQQGAQIKDAFGGVGPALRETASFAAGLITPYTAAAVAVAALALAWKQGSDEGVEFNKQLVLTGNFAGTSAGQLQSMAVGIDAITGTQRQASAALAEVVGTGKFTVSQIQEIGLAAVAMEEATGKAVSETVDEFKRLADEPAKAAAKLNEQYHFLTASVYEQITALEQQGDAAGAAQLAIDTFAEAMTQRASEIEGGLGLVETAWKKIKDGAAEAWDEMLGVGRAETPEERLSGLTKGDSFNLGKLAANSFILGPLGGAWEAYQQYKSATLTDEQRAKQIGVELAAIQADGEQAWQEGLQAQLQSDAVAAQARVDQIRKSALTNEEKRKKALDDLSKDLAKIRAVNPNDTRLDPANVAKLEADIAEKYKDPKTPKQKAFQDDAATRLLIQLREQQAELETQLLTTEKLTEAQKKRAAFESEIADLKEKKVLTADQKSLLANEAAIKAQLDKNVAVAEEVRLHNESIKLQERAQQLQATIQSSLQGRQELQQRQLDAFGLGRQEQERVDAERNIFREFRRYQDQLNKATPKDLLGSEEYQQASADIKKGLDDALQANRDYYAKLDQLREDSTNGQKAALEDYLDSAKDVAGQTYDLFSNAFAGLEDALVEFVMTGKLSFADLANAIIADLVRIEIRKAIAFSLGGEDGKSGLGGLLGTGLSALGAWFDGGSGLSGAAAASSKAGASISGYSGDLSNFIAGGRALGGPVAANELYQVGENDRPELLRQGGKNYLIPGDNGQVIPMRGQGGGSVSVGQMVFPSVTDRRTAEEASFIMQRRLGQLVAGTARAQ